MFPDARRVYGQDGLTQLAGNVLCVCVYHCLLLVAVLPSRVVVSRRGTSKFLFHV
ncbi:hypothetical protein BaRGS_00034665, partial [Batillaria attramentaria]